MLIDKWNLAPTYAPVVGDRNPAIAEAWYFAVWAYNGWSISNNPNYCDRDNGGQLCPRPPFNGSQNRTDYPYQELVWGYPANPPTEGGARLWDPAALTLPDTRSIPSTCPAGTPGRLSWRCVDSVPQPAFVLPRECP